MQRAPPARPIWGRVIGPCGNSRHPANDVLLALEEDRHSLGKETLDIAGERFLDPLWGETIACE